MTYFFILGRNPDLSMAELHALLPVGYHTIAYAKQVLIAECGMLDADILMRRLGGTIKMVEIVLALSSSRGSMATGTISEIASHLLAMTDASKKLFLGLSAYPLDPKVKLPSVRELS